MLEAGPREDVNGRSVRAQVMIAEGATLREEEEAEGEVGIVPEAEGNLGELRRGEPVGAHGAEVGPSRLGAVVGQERDDVGDERSAGVCRRGEWRAEMVAEVEERDSSRNYCH